MKAEKQLTGNHEIWFRDDPSCLLMLGSYMLLKEGLQFIVTYTFFYSNKECNCQV